MTPRLPTRRGKSLIEMLAVMAAMTAVLATAGKLLHNLSRAERSVRDAAVVGRTELRLARDFRKDVRSATSAEIFPAGDRAGIRLLGPAGTIDYVPAEEQVTRAATGREDRQTDAYRLGPSDPSFSITDGRLAMLTVEPSTQASAHRRASAGAVQVVVRIGADRFGFRSDAGSPVDGARNEAVEAPKPAEASR